MDTKLGVFVAELDSELWICCGLGMTDEGQEGAYLLSRMFELISNQSLFVQEEDLRG